jgi:hypothetical protein
MSFDFWIWLDTYISILEPNNRHSSYCYDLLIRKSSHVMSLYIT